MYNVFNVNINKISSVLEDVIVFDQNTFNDNRGSLSIKFEGKNNQIDSNFFSLKESISNRFAARGLHHQIEPYGQDKIIFVEDGEILDFFFDTTDKKKNIYCVRLESNINKSLFIPKNYAHGFIALKKTKFKYLCFGKYSEEHEVTYNIFPSISKMMNLNEIILSEKDSSYPKIKINKIYDI